MYATTSKSSGTCRNAPPVIINNGDMPSVHNTAFPVVLADWWCGEWEESESSKSEKAKKADAEIDNIPDGKSRKKSDEKSQKNDNQKSSKVEGSTPNAKAPTPPPAK